MSYLRFLILAVGLFLLTFSAEGNCATIAAKSSSQSDVAAAISSAAGGDTITIPAGNSAWSNLSIPDSKKITLQGQGSGSTVITGTSVVLYMNQSGSRVTGMGFVQNGGDTLINVKGRGWRIDHCKFTNNTSGKNFAVMADGYNVTVSPAGLVDHCDFTNCKVANGGMGNFNSASAQWAKPLGLGTDDAVYVEDCTFNYDGRGNCIDTNRGGSYVFRYNTVTMSHCEVHSLQADNERASRKWEIYNNTLTVTSPWWATLFIRGGTGVAFNNTFIGPWTESIVLDNVRDGTTTGSSGLCNGSSPWDGNASGQNGWPCRDQIGRSTDQWVWTSSNPYPPQESDPAYFWNNTLNGAPSPVTLRGTHIQKGRDVFIDAGPKPGYTPYTYPHPLQASGGAAPSAVPGTPGNLRVQ